MKDGEQECIEKQEEKGEAKGEKGCWGYQWYLIGSRVSEWVIPLYLEVDF